MFWSKTKRIKDLYSENFKSLMKRIDNYIRKWKKYSMFMD